MLGHVILLCLQLQVDITWLLTNLEWVESITLELRSPVKVHVFECHGTCETHITGSTITSLFDASHLGLFTLVLGPLQLLMLF